MILDESEQLYKIGEVAEALDISVRSIRYYEEEGLITPFRSEGGTRIYSRHHIDRLRSILRLIESGYSLGVIKVLATIREKQRTGDDSQKAVSSQLDGMLEGINKQLAQLQALAKQIGATRTTIRKCAGCRNKPTSKGCPECPARKRRAEIELLNLVWDQEG